MGESFIQGHRGSGGLDVKGRTVIKRVTNGYTVSKGSFVTELNGLSTGLQLEYSTYSSSRAVWLTRNRYVVYHRNLGKTCSIDLVEVNGDTITKVSTCKTTINSTSTSYYKQQQTSNMHLTRISDSKIIGCGLGSDGYDEIYLNIYGISVNGDTISVNITQDNGSYGDYGRSSGILSPGRYFDDLNSYVLAKIENISEDNGWPRRIHVGIANDNTSFFSNYYQLSTDLNRDSAMVGLVKNSAIGGVSVVTAGTLYSTTSGIQIINLSLSNNTLVEHSRTSYVTVSPDFYLIRNDLGLIDLGDDTFLVFNNLGPTIQYSRYNLSGTKIASGSIDAKYKILSISHSEYRDDDIIAIALCGDLAGNNTILKFSLSEENSIIITESDVFSTDYPTSIHACDGVTGYCITSGDATYADDQGYVKVYSLSNGIVPSTSGSVCCGVALSAGSGGDEIKVIVP